MFTSVEISLIRERNAEMLREVQAERLSRRPRANRGPRTGWRRTVGAFSLRGFAVPSAEPVRAGREGVGPEEH